MKRFDINTVFHKSLTGGHPKEALEASFDIIQDETNIRGHQLEAETLLAACQVITFFSPSESGAYHSCVLERDPLYTALMSCFNSFLGDSSLPFGARLPFWYLRLTHTRLADAILDICGVPSKESIRRVCLRILTQFTAPPPSQLTRFLPIKRKRSNSRSNEENPRDRLLSSLKNAVETHGLPQAAASSLETFATSGCMPLPLEITEAIDAIKASLSKLRQSLIGNTSNMRRLKRFEDAGKSLKHLLNLTQLLYNIGIGPLLGSKSNAFVLNRPLYISLDLGLRQRRHHYHGHILYQCISLKENYFDGISSIDDENETNETILSSGGPGLKFAEGGRYDDLVRRYRPPGNFGSALLNHYTTAPIPKVRHQKVPAFGSR